MKMNLFNNRRFKHGSLATLISVIFIVAIIIVNIIATLVLERYPLNIDLTKNNRFKMSQESIDFVKSIDKEVTITVLAEENQYKSYNELYTQAYHIINSYAKHNNKVNVNFVDLVKNPGFAQKHPTVTLAAADILVHSDLRETKMTSSSLFNSEQSSSGEVAYNSEAEQKMTAALMFVTDENPVTVTLLTGHENVSVSGYVSLLESNNYAVQSQNLATEEIDSDSSFLIFPAPKVDITADQAKKLQRFLDNDGKFGKSLVFIASPSIAVGPVLKSFLADWGMEIGTDIIMETNMNNVVNNPYVTDNQIADEELAKQLKYKNLQFIVPSSNPIFTLFEDQDIRKTQVITKTYDSAILTSDDEEAQPQYDEYNTIVKGTRSKVVDQEKATSTVIAIGSPGIIAEAFLKEPSYNNSDVVLTLTNNIVDKEEGIKIIPVRFTNETISISVAQSKIANTIFIVIIPIALLIIMLAIWLRRRHL